jgi:hypothetical protein
MSFSEDIVQKVWEKGKIVEGYDPKKWRKDACEAWMNKSSYGDRSSSYGWEIDHIKPESESGTDDLSNLHPLQWENNASKQAGRLVCVVTSSGNENIHKQ